MTKALDIFNELKSKIAVFVGPVKDVVVSDFASSNSAVEAAKEIKKYAKLLEDRRKELTTPLREQIDQINQYVKDIKIPLDEAEYHIERQLSAFARAAEEKKQAELKRAEQERLAKEAELRAKQEQEKADQEAARALFGGPAEEEVTPDQPTLEEQHGIEQAILKGECEQKKFDINEMQIKNVRKNWKCEATDLSKVPREFLIVTLNDRAVLAAARAGITNIPGVRVWQDLKVAIGVNTYVPRKALQG